MDRGLTGALGCDLRLRTGRAFQRPPRHLGAEDEPERASDSPTRGAGREMDRFVPDQDSLAEEHHPAADLLHVFEKVG